MDKRMKPPPDIIGEGVMLSGYPSAAFVRSSVSALYNFDKTDGEYSLPLLMT